MSLFDEIGGQAAVKAAVDIFYQKLLADDTIKHFFDGIDMQRQAAKQTAFLTLALGGPNQYSGKDLKSAHAGLVKQGLSHPHFDAVAGHLVATLQELKVEHTLIDQVVAIVESTRADVLSLS